MVTALVYLLRITMRRFYCMAFLMILFYTFCAISALTQQFFLTSNSTVKSCGLPEVLNQK